MKKMVEKSRRKLKLNSKKYLKAKDKALLEHAVEIEIKWFKHYGVDLNEKKVKVQR